MSGSLGATRLYLRETVKIHTKCHHFVVLVLAELLERVEVVCNVPGNDVDTKLVPRTNVLQMHIIIKVG